MGRVDPLAAYNRKRDFSRTSEPPGHTAVFRPGYRFVVQKHAARRLHWDLRLEIDGVLKSWAVTRGPSHDPKHKRLAVRTEDHPLAYAEYEGVITAGEYGGGTVMLWDEGSWAPVPGKSPCNLDEGHLHFILSGQRMRGEWLLVRTKSRARDKRENWLLRKVDDAFAETGDALVERALTSVRTGRTMQEIAVGKEYASRKASRPRSKPPAFESVQLASPGSSLPEGPDWMHEIKYDGYRALLAIGGKRARIYTRTGIDWTDRFAVLADCAAVLPVSSALIDGEIVVFGKNGNPDFAALQTALGDGSQNFQYFAFDLLQLDGADMKSASNLERKDRLQAIIPLNDSIRFSDHILGDGAQLFAALCMAGAEGVVSKRINAPYLGRRTEAWLKIKCMKRQEFAIIGWTDRKGAPRHIGALLLAWLRHGSLTYAGKVGTGFSDATSEQLIKKLQPLCIDGSAVAVPAQARRGVSWVRPELVAEVRYADVTTEGVLRHASFMALRDDKNARSIEMETAVSANTPSPVRISNANRVISPDVGITKGQLANYYEEMAGPILAHAMRRPLSLVRCPEGIAGECFFQRHGADSLGDAIHSVAVRGKDGKKRDYMYLDDAHGLRECVQMGAIELHGWGSRANKLEYPDRLVIDLDPDEGLGFDAVRRAAVEARTALADLGLRSFPMLSGGKGLHVIIPIKSERRWPDVTDFAHRFAAAMAAKSPEKYVATMAKAKRKGRIFIDWMRNQRGSTAVLPYTVRARKGAPVATPILWSELTDITGGGHFSLLDSESLLARAASPELKHWGAANQSLPDV